MAIEAASSDFWYQFVGLTGKIMGLTTFGLSAPASDIFNYFKLNAERAYEIALELVGEKTCL
jgi:transketolase